MIDINNNQELAIFKALTFRGIVREIELDGIVNDMERVLQKAGASRVGDIVTATFGVEGNRIDVELILPIDKNVGNIGGYQYKDNIIIKNALLALYKGEAQGFQAACVEINRYITENKLQPVTVGYNVIKGSNNNNIKNKKDVEIEVYIGISTDMT